MRAYTKLTKSVRRRFKKRKSAWRHEIYSGGMNAMTGVETTRPQRRQKNSAWFISGPERSLMEVARGAVHSHPRLGLSKEEKPKQNCVHIGLQASTMLPPHASNTTN